MLPPVAGQVAEKEVPVLRFKRAGFLTKIVVLGLLIYMGTSLLNLRGQIQQVELEREATQQQVVQLQMENRQMNAAIANSEDPDVLEQAMRDRGYINENEIAYRDVSR